MRERRLAEIGLLRAKYHKVTHGANAEWVIVHDLPLPPGWATTSVDVLFFLDAGYPQTPPDNFYVPAGLRLAGGGQPGNMNVNGKSHDGRSWDMFSWHHEFGWKPAAKVEEGTNLLTFMLTVENRFREAS